MVAVGGGGGGLTLFELCGGCGGGGGPGGAAPHMVVGAVKLPTQLLPPFPVPPGRRLPCCWQPVGVPGEMEVVPQPMGAAEVMEQEA